MSSRTEEIFEYLAFYYFQSWQRERSCKEPFVQYNRRATNFLFSPVVYQLLFQEKSFDITENEEDFSLDEDKKKKERRKEVVKDALWLTGSKYGTKLDQSCSI